MSLKTLKKVTLGTLKTSGVFTIVKSSSWRRRRLLILAYHGISLVDEHLWRGGQFMAPEIFRGRLELLRRNRCTVLPLDEALTRLYVGDLPDRSVAITFDDGTHDFYTRGYPLLKEFNFPATLYLTTFYSQVNLPVFNLICSYLLWKARDKSLHLKPITGRNQRIDLFMDAVRAEALKEINEMVRAENFSAAEKDALAESLAKELGINYDDLRHKKILHLMQPPEISALAAEGVDIQLHTHRHRTPMNRELFRREISENRACIQQMTGKSASHFCYPSGVWDYRFLPWLKELGIESATTCDLGLASSRTDPLLLPRLVDLSALSPVEFESWLTGVSVALPRRRMADLTLQEN